MAAPSISAYTSDTAAYSDLQAGNLDFMDQVPASALVDNQFEKDLPGHNTAGFNDDTRAFPSIPARHDVARREHVGRAPARSQGDEAGWLHHAATEALGGGKGDLVAGSGIAFEDRGVRQRSTASCAGRRPTERAESGSSSTAGSPTDIAFTP